MPMSEKALTDFKTETENDFELNELKKIIEFGWPDEKARVPPELQNFIVQSTVQSCLSRLIKLLTTQRPICIIGISINIPYKEKLIPAEISHSSAKKIPGQKKYWIVLTHGAGGDMHTSQLVALTKYLMNLNCFVLRFTCKGLNMKYRMNVFNSVLEYLNETYEPKGILIGGRSMGARSAVMLCSDPEGTMNTNLCDKIMGIICLSYPLHKPGDKKELREEPFRTLRTPVFFLSGTKDEMCDKVSLDKILKKYNVDFDIHWLVGCDHSAKPAKSYEDDMYTEAFQHVSDWCKKVLNL
ncbi:testis-expressed protein 30-like [Uloborus diversus]|uniref:testis-expressed protein 30-like n=1 Tax=Uloborus diversus TaxID=327109 RepID=UPI002409949C|nr:testis-expressed protein 30-like [Uloborus diversus]